MQERIIELSKEIEKDYEGKDSKEVKLVADLLPSIEGKNVIVINDIVDTEKTLNYLIPYLKRWNLAV